MSKVELVILEPDYFSSEARQVLSERFRLKNFGPGYAATCEVLLAGLSHRLDEAFLMKFANLRLVASLTTGTNHIDSAYLDSKGVRLASLNSVKSDLAQVWSTAELAIALILGIVRRLPQASMSIVREAVWDRIRFFGHEVRGRRLGLVGFGRIGRMVCEMAQPLGLEVRAYDPLDIVPAQLRATSLEELIVTSEVISLHASYSGSQILAEREIQLMGRGTFLVNTARGELVSEEAIASAIKSGHLGGYASDVLSGENLVDWDIRSDALVTLAREGYNVSITPHLGGCTNQGFEKTQIAMARYLVSLLDDGEFFH